MENTKKYIAEFIGTAVLVTFGCGTAVAVGCDAASGSGYLLTALAFGLVIVAMAYSIGNVSGCHINPAVSIAMLIRRKMSGKDFVGYVIAQCLGAIFGAFILWLIFGGDCGFGANGLYNGRIINSLFIEIVLTFVFVLAVCGATSKIENSSVAGIVIGLSLTLVHILGIALTGTSVNPARSLGPALFAGGEALTSLWVFIVGPLLGGAFAGAIYAQLTSENKTSAKGSDKK